MVVATHKHHHVSCMDVTTLKQGGRRSPESELAEDGAASAAWSAAATVPGGSVGC